MEWFAEAYAKFYEPGHGSDPTKTNALQAIDKDTAAYFAKHVHKHAAKPEA